MPENNEIQNNKDDAIFQEQNIDQGIENEIPNTELTEVYIERLDEAVNGMDSLSEIANDIFSDDHLSDHDISSIAETSAQNAIDQDNPQAAADIITVFSEDVMDGNTLDNINDLRDDLNGDSSVLDKMDEYIDENIDNMAEPEDSSNYLEIGDTILEIDPEGNVIDLDTGHELEDILPGKDFAISDSSPEEISMETTDTIDQMFDPLESFLNDVSQELSNAGMLDDMRQDFIENNISDIDSGLNDGSLTQEDTGYYVDQGLELIQNEQDVDTGTELNAVESFDNDMMDDFMDELPEPDFTTSDDTIFDNISNDDFNSPVEDISYNDFGPDINDYESFNFDDFDTSGGEE